MSNLFDIRQIAEAISGKVLDAVPIKVKVLDAVPIKVHPATDRTEVTVLEELSDSDKEFLRNYAVLNPIGAHCLLQEGLSGAFAFFLLRKFAENEIKGFTGPLNSSVPSRLQVKLDSHGIKSLLTDMINAALSGFKRSSLDEPLTLSVVDNRRFFALLISFNRRNFPNPHKDTGKRQLNDVRILWDFHPRGRCLLLSRGKTVYHEKGIFLENCGVEICGGEMCGNNAFRGDEFLFHRGWDRRERDEMCPLVTAVLDLTLSNGTRQDLFNAVNSHKFREDISRQMEIYVDEQLHECCQTYGGKTQALNNLIRTHNAMNIQLSHRFSDLYEAERINEGNIMHLDGSTVDYFRTKLEEEKERDEDKEDNEEEEKKEEKYDEVDWLGMLRNMII